MLKEVLQWLFLKSIIIYSGAYELETFEIPLSTLVAKLLVVLSSYFRKTTQCYPYSTDFYLVNPFKIL